MLTYSMEGVELESEFERMCGRRDSIMFAMSLSSRKGSATSISMWVNCGRRKGEGLIEFELLSRVVVRVSRREAVNRCRDSYAQDSSFEMVSIVNALRVGTTVKSSTSSPSPTVADFSVNTSSAHDER